MKAIRVWAAAFALVSPIRAVSADQRALPPLPTINIVGAFPSVLNEVHAAEARAHAQAKDPAACGKLGMVLDAYEMYAAAAVCYRRAHILNPRSFEWLYDLGWVKFKQGQYRAAVKAFRAALEIQPHYLPARLKLAESLLLDSQLDTAEEIYRNVIGKDPQNAEAQYGLGRAEVARGNPRAALTPLERACKLFPQYGVAEYALAIAYRNLGQPEKAKEHFALSQANPTSVPPVVDPLRAAVQELNQSPLPFMQRGLEMEQAGDLPGAIRAYEQAAKMNPGLVEAHVNLIQLYARVGESEKAQREYFTAVRLDPRRSDCYYNYGVLMFQLGKYAEAEEAFRRAIEIDPQYAEAHNNLGFLFEKKGQLQEALEEFRKAIAARPDYRLARFHIGQILVNQGDYAGAIGQFSKILTPDDASTPAYLYALGATYARAGDTRNALPYLRKARAEAAARGEVHLLAPIDKDLKALEESAGQQ